MYLSYCTAAPKLKSADINIYTIDLVTIFTGTLLVQMGGTLYVSTDRSLNALILSSEFLDSRALICSSNAAILFLKIVEFICPLCYQFITQIIAQNR